MEMRAMRVGKRPLQGTKALVTMAMSRSRGLWMIRHPMTPQALHPNPMHIVKLCLPWAPAFWKKLAEDIIKAQNIDFKALKEKAADADQLRGEYTKILDKTLREIFKSLYGVTI
jgi:hypothetical protein